MDLGQLFNWVDRPPRQPAVVTGCLFAALVGLGFVDSVTGSNLSWGAFYMLGVIAVTVVAGGAMGIAAAMLSATLWGAADIITSQSLARRQSPTRHRAARNDDSSAWQVSHPGRV